MANHHRHPIMIGMIFFLLYICLMLFPLLIEFQWIYIPVHLRVFYLVAFLLAYGSVTAVYYFYYKSHRQHYVSRAFHCRDLGVIVATYLLKVGQFYLLFLVLSHVIFGTVSMSWHQFLFNLGGL